MTDTVKPVRVIIDDDSYCPKCGHNRDKSCVSTIDMGGGVKKCQQCDCTWSEIDGEAPKQPVADESVREAWQIIQNVTRGIGMQPESVDEATATIEKIISERETLKEAGIELNRANERHFNKATELHAENEILKADLKKANILAHDIGWERDQLRDDNERLKKAASNYASAVSTCQLQNTPEWMEYIVENSNQFLEIFSVKGRLFINRHGNISVEAAIKKAGEQG